MRVATVALLAFWLSRVVTAEITDDAPKLLLTPRHLRRLQRDRERKTVRWMNFEDRIQSAPDSPERGFELALYYAVTHDPERGKEAVRWALAHKCDGRQAALVLDWCRALFSKAEVERLTTGVCDVKAPNSADEIRDEVFMRVARDGYAQTDRWKELLSSLQAGGFQQGDTLYAACEYLLAVRATQRTDLREDARQFFFNLPQEVLLSLRPEKVEHPDWMTHIAALALVSLDPNLETSQYLQGWAMETAQTIRDGPGVGYEFLWADPYLPGVGYQNVDPWVYDANGRLFARTNWEPGACWIAISTSGTDGENCPPQWQASVQTFGNLTLVPMTQTCTEVPRRRGVNQFHVLWKLQPHEALFFVSGTQQESVRADAAGMWRLSADIEGKVCTSPDTLKSPPARKSMRNH